MLLYRGPDIPAMIIIFENTDLIVSFTHVSYHVCLQLFKLFIDVWFVRKIFGRDTTIGKSGI